MNDLLDTLFGPLNKNSCIYFLLVSVIFFTVLVFASIIEIIYIIRNIKNLNMRAFINPMFMFFYLFIGYLVNRILYTMCSNSLI